jgi:hypothetical protein
VIVAALGTGAVLGVRASSRTSTQDAADAGAATAPAPLGPDAVVACPIFDVARDDVAKPTGWLGAAAATLACEHARVRLGGAGARTLVPAELVPGISREPSDHAPLDPFSADGAVETSRKSAARASARIDGVVKREGHDIAVSMVIRTKDGRELAKGEGKGFELFVAISNAMRAVRSAFAPTEPSAFQKEWLRVDSLDASEVSASHAITSGSVVGMICGITSGSSAISTVAEDSLISLSCTVLPLTSLARNSFSRKTPCFATNTLFSEAW